LKISNFEIGAKKTFVIAEIGNNHNGCAKTAMKMIDAANKAGADCVKFQMRNMESVYRKKTLAKEGEDLGTEYVLDLLERFELSKDEHKELSDYCKTQDILYMCTPWDKDSISTLEGFNVPGYKVASADLTNIPLIAELVKTKKPLILSTGMSTPEEIKLTTDFLNKNNADFALLHCNSTYPAPLHDINLKWLDKLKKIHPLVGYSGHERGISVTLAAVAMGSKIIERHFTFDRNMEGPDHAASLELDEFKELVSGIREIEEALGEGLVRKVSQGEMINRENLSKSLVSTKAINIGTILTKDHIKVRSPGQGLSPQFFDDLIGVKLKRDLKSEDFFFLSDIKGNNEKPKEYSFNLEWGIPVRYHDYQEYADRINPDIFEFHLSYSDMNLDPSEYIKEVSRSGFVVHAPELFSNSRLMDLATPDEDYRNDSIIETQRVVDITKSLKKFFPRTEKPLIVANIGGFSMDKNIPSEKIKSYYERFNESMKKIDFDGVELIPQNMAPFPWHFGGQRYQNMFISADEIVSYCKKLNLRICFDISHCMLACNHFGYDLYEFSEKVAPYTAHIHVGDASGVNGEGLQIGDGEIDFKRLGNILTSKCPDSSFIPEIWQGHKNGGEDFWIALKKLEGML
jgi:N-acetylneuraminate synthase